MTPILLTSITNLQTLTGVVAQGQDSTGKPNTFFDIAFTVDQENAAQINNFIFVQNTTPPNDSISFDVQGKAPSTGMVNITVTWNEVEGDATTAQSAVFQIPVTEDPSLPGPVTQLDLTSPGTVTGA
jgi:hypothetical protein